MRRSVLAVFMIAVLNLLFVSIWAQVQTTTEIRGTVRDSTGGVLPGATVRIVNQETGFQREVATNDQGYYSIPQIQPGSYTVTASLPGFKTGRVQDREVESAIPAQVNFTLEIGEITEEITVSGLGEELINKSTAELSTAIDQTLVENLPLESRNFFDLLALAPNTSPQYLSTGNMSFGQHSLRRVSAAGSTESSGVFAAGNRDSASNVSIDGANQQIALYNMTVNIQSAATVKEVKLQTASANAEFGYGSNAVSVITKSGTNDYHGQAFWQHRNDNLDANGFFTNLAGNVLPEYKRNTFGASAGGPIIQDKLLFFGNYEGSRLRQSIQGNSRVPTAALRSGDFSDFHPLLPGGGLAPTPTIYNPYDFDPETGLRNPYPNNQINSDHLDPAMQVLLDFTPLPNTVIDGVPQFSGPLASEIDTNQYTTRIDWEKSADTTIYGRYSFAERDAIRTDLLPPLEGESTPSSTHTAVVNWTEVLTSTIVNNLSVSYSRPKWGIGRPLDVPDVSGQMGLSNTSALTGAPGINQPDFRIGDSGLFVWDPTQHTYQVKDDFSWNVGKHSFKLGLHVTERRLYFTQESFDKGLFYFDNIYTQACPQGNQACDDARVASGISDPGGFAFADLLLGSPWQTRLELRNVTWHGHQRYYGAYFQDTWQIHPDVTLNLGLRYEHWNPWLLPRNNTVSFDFSGDGSLLYALQNPLDVTDPGTDYGRDAALSGAIPREGYETSSLDFAPRIGVVWALTPDTTIRVAGGIFYAGNINTNQLSDIQAGAPPFVLSSVQQTSRSENEPPISVQEQFPVPAASSVPQAFDDPLGSVRVLGQREYPSPAVYQWSLSAQHRLNTNWSVHLDYLGSHTIHNSQFIELNPGALPQGDLADVPLQDRRRLPGWSTVQTWAPWGYARYNSGTLGLRNREWKGLSFMANFMWAKNITSSRSLIGSDTGNRHYQYWDIWRGKASFTPDLRFVSGWSYKLPFGQNRTYALDGVADAVLGGWVVSGITEFSEGPPFEISTSDNSGTGVGNQLADRVAGCDTEDAPGDRFEWFNTACFAQPAFGTWGNTSQGIVDGPGINNWNLTLAKSFRFAEDQAIEFRMETYNTFNHTQWGNVNGNLTSSSFGRIGGTRPARQIQFALFYEF